MASYEFYKELINGASHPQSLLEKAEPIFEDEEELLETSAQISAWSKRTGVSKDTIERYWEEAKESAKRAGLTEKDGPRYWRMIAGITKKRLGLPTKKASKKTESLDGVSQHAYWQDMLGPTDNANLDEGLMDMAAQVWQFVKKLWDTIFNRMDEMRAIAQKINTMTDEEKLKYIYDEAAKAGIEKFTIDANVKQLKTELEGEEGAAPVPVKEGLDEAEDPKVPGTDKLRLVYSHVADAMKWLVVKLKPIFHFYAVGSTYIFAAVVALGYKAVIFTGATGGTGWTVLAMQIVIPLAILGITAPHIFNKSFWAK